MSPNPFSALLHSRKFWLAILDTIFALTTFFVAKYAPTAAEDVKFVFVTLQPVFVAVILAIAWEDTKQA
jgi:hypothetical protein